MLKAVLTLLCALALTIALPGAVADDIVGVSGECYSEDYESGGHAHLAVTDDGEVSQGGIIDPDDPTTTENGAGAAVLTFAQGTPAYVSGETEASCTAPDAGEGNPPRAGEDYLEVHVLGFQVCYDSQVNVATSEDEWACGVRPHGPPA